MGKTCGMITLRNTCLPVKPTDRAASNWPFGMDARELRNISDNPLTAYKERAKMAIHRLSKSLKRMGSERDAAN